MQATRKCHSPFVDPRKLIKPYDYVPSDFSTLLTATQQVRQEVGSKNVEKTSQPHHSSGHDTSQYAFAHVGVQAFVSETLPKGAGDMTDRHGWQPVLMTGMMLMAKCWWGIPHADGSTTGSVSSAATTSDR